MRSIPAQIKSYAPGFALALVIALLAKGIEALLPFDVIGASVIAMFIGMLINGYRKPGKTTAPGVKFTAKKILKFAIILLGASLNVTTILNVGRMSLTVMLFTLLTCFGGGYFIGRALGLDWKLSNLISAGTGICGGSAIAAVAPVIDAKDSDIAYALSAITLPFRPLCDYCSRAQIPQFPDFVLERGQNLGKVALSDTKKPFLCLKAPKIGVLKGKSAQKCLFCARADGELALGKRKMSFLQITAHASKI